MSSPSSSQANLECSPWSASQYPCPFSPLVPPVQRRIRLQPILEEKPKLLTSNNAEQQTTEQKKKAHTIWTQYSTEYNMLYDSFYFINSNSNWTKHILTMRILVPFIHRESAKECLTHFQLFTEYQKVEDSQIIDHLSINKEDLATTICWQMIRFSINKAGSAVAKLTNNEQKAKSLTLPELLFTVIKRER